MSGCFKVGDRIRAKGAVAAATIVGTTFNSILQESEYQIQWDHVKGVHSYTFDEGHAQWEQESPATPPVIKFEKINTDDVKGENTWYPLDKFLPIQDCKHAFTWYHGITENFEYCTKCDEKKQ